MSNELQTNGPGSGKTVYFLIRNRIGQIYNPVVELMQTYLTANYTQYVIAATEQGTASNYYVGTIPGTLSAGVYSVVAKQQLGGTAAETDPTVAADDEHWNGTAISPLSDLATSGQVGSFLPIRPYRGQMIQNFPLYLKSSADHVTGFTSGIVSGQIARDGGLFGVLQSGSFTEVGLGWYNTNLTSGDLLANTAKLYFTATGVSGGTADPLPLAIILQRVSGQ